MTDQEKAPIETLRDGSTKIAIWKNQGDKGAFYSVEPHRTYPVDEDTWKDVHSFSGTDVLKLQRLLGLAYMRIEELRAADREKLAA